MLNIRDHGGQYGGGKYIKNSNINDAALKKIKDGGATIRKGMNIANGYGLSALARSGDGTKWGARNNDNATAAQRVFIYNSDFSTKLINTTDPYNAAATDAVMSYDGSRLYVSKNDGNLTTFNTSTGGVVSQTSYGDGIRTMTDICIDATNNIYASLNGDLSKNNLYKINSSGATVWAKNGIVVGATSVEVNSVNGDVYIGSQGNSSNSTSLTLVCFDKDGVQKWSKNYGQVYGIQKLLYNPIYDRLLAVSTQGVCYVLNPSTGDTITSISGIDNTRSTNGSVDDEGNYYMASSVANTNVVKLSGEDYAKSWIGQTPVNTSGNDTPTHIFALKNSVYYSAIGSNIVSEIEKYMVYKILK